MLEFDYEAYVMAADQVNNGVIDDSFVYDCCVETIHEELLSSMCIDYEMLELVFKDEGLEPIIVDLLFDRKSIKENLIQFHRDMRAKEKSQEKDRKRLIELERKVRKLKEKLEL